MTNVSNWLQHYQSNDRTAPCLSIDLLTNFMILCFHPFFQAKIEDEKAFRVEDASKDQNHILSTTSLRLNINRGH